MASVSQSLQGIIRPDTGETTEWSLYHNPYTGNHSTNYPLPERHTGLGYVVYHSPCTRIIRQTPEGGPLNGLCITIPIQGIIRPDTRGTTKMASVSQSLQGIIRPNTRETTEWPLYHNPYRESFDQIPEGPLKWPLYHNHYTGNHSTQYPLPWSPFCGIHHSACARITQTSTLYPGLRSVVHHNACARITQTSTLYLPWSPFCGTSQCLRKDHPDQYPPLSQRTSDLVPSLLGNFPAR